MMQPSAPPDHLAGAVSLLPFDSLPLVVDDE